MHDDLDLRDFGGVTRLFPLPGVVLFPHVVLPLHIFEPRYRQMTADALAGDRLITMIQVRPDADWTGAAEPSLEEVGCLGKIINHDRLPDGRYNLLLLGRKRVRLVRELSVPTLYRQAAVEILDEIEPPGPAEPRRSELIRLFRSAVSPEPELAGLLDRDLPLDVLTDLLAHALGLTPALRQAFLAERAVDRRADGLIALLKQVDRSDPDASRSHRPFPPFSVN
jgi:Lon protease-like protein